MSNFLFPTIMGPGIGVWPGNGSVTVRNVHSATLAAGTVVALDLTQSDADVLSFVPGHTTAAGASDTVFGCVIVPASVATQRTGQFLVMLETVAVGATGKAAMTGQVPALLNFQVADFGTLGMPLAAGSASGTVGLIPLSAVASNATRGEKIIAYLQHTATIASSASTMSASLFNVWFNGTGAGFGQNAA